jgi:hypothetical protein
MATWLVKGAICAILGSSERGRRACWRLERGETDPPRRCDDFGATAQAAVEGLVEARAAAEAKAAAKAAERASAQRGERPPLPAHPLAEVDAADYLIAADEMLRVRVMSCGLSGV